MKNRLSNIPTSSQSFLGKQLLERVKFPCDSMEGGPSPFTPVAIYFVGGPHDGLVKWVDYLSPMYQFLVSSIPSFFVASDTDTLMTNPKRDTYRRVKNGWTRTTPSYAFGHYQYVGRE